MFLKRFLFINWGNVPTIDFEFGPINLFSGGNGSGKTTAADAIQTVMTAAHENLFQYNPGQDETTQRGRGGKRVRTLASYVLGCDDGSYARLEPADGYLAAIFHPSKGEVAEPFTAVIGIRAWLDLAGSNTIAREEAIHFYILPGVELEQSHFIEESGGARKIVSLNDFQTLLIKEFGKRLVERYDGKKAYLKRLYGALRGKSESVSDLEAVAAARAFSRFMAYKPVKSIDRFVADEILEKKDLGEAIRSVSSQLKTIHGMERDAARLTASIETLARAKAHAESYIDNWIELNLLDYTLARAKYEITQQDYLRGKSLQNEKQNALAETEKAIRGADEDSKRVRHQLISLEAQRQGIDALKKKDELEAESKGLDDALLKAVRIVLEEDGIVTANLQATQDILKALLDSELAGDLPRECGMDARALARSVGESARDLLPEIHNLVQHDALGALSVIGDRMDALRQVQSTHSQWHAFWHDKRGGSSFRDQLAEMVHTRKGRYHSLGSLREEKKREIGKLGANQVTYPAFIERTLSAIRQQCPAADPHVLCDHVEIKDPRWQMAIEGYIGGSRFSILVDGKYEAEAIKIVRGMSGRDNRAKVIQGEKAAKDAARVTLDQSSIIHVLEFTHAVAKAYMIASYGSVLRVPSAEELRGTRRGITEDGMGSGAYSMWRCDLPDSELVFGSGARERALVAKQNELETIEIEWNRENDRMQQAVALLDLVDSLHASKYGDALADVLSIHRTIEENSAMLEQLDLTEHQDLEERLRTLQEKSDALKDREAELNAGKGRLQTELEEIQKQLLSLNSQQERNLEKVDKHEAALKGITDVWPDFDVDSRLDHADREAKDLNVEFAGNHRVEVERFLHLAEKKTSEEIFAHNQQSGRSDAIVYDAFRGEYGPKLFESICDVSREIDRVHNILKNNILVEKRAELAELKDSFNNAFVSHLCHAIYQALGEGKRQIEQLNKELQHHRFGADLETFRFAGDWVPEYRDYARFFEEIVKTPGLGDEVTLFNASLSEKSGKVRDELMDMLLDEDEARAMRDLERIADYRNYRRYEIYKEVEGKAPIPLSEYGTGSGGQLETPAYIIRSAAITSAFRFSEGRAHLRMVLVDEAFSKMDETRSREVISYLTESLGLQLIFIMPTSKCGPFMDLISNEFVFAKVPSPSPRGQLNTRVLVDRKQCNQERIKALWETHRRSVYQQAELDFMEEFSAG
jgi:DNA repair exonuclease SbcCD ATPase subunit